MYEIEISIFQSEDSSFLKQGNNFTVSVFRLYVFNKLESSADKMLLL